PRGHHRRCRGTRRRHDREPRRAIQRAGADGAAADAETRRVSAPVALRAWFGKFASRRSLLERDDFSSNRHPALPYWWSMIFFRKPVSTFRDHALVAGALIFIALPGAAQAPSPAEPPVAIEIESRPIAAFDIRDHSRRQFGLLEFRGGLALSSSYR